MKTINENISYIPASSNPLSSDIVFITTENATWIFDVGSDIAVIEEINKLHGRKNIVLSHFHPDHTANISNVNYNKLYVSRHTAKYISGGTIVEDSYFDKSDNIQIKEIPSSHAKGCLCLIYKDYAFLGDAAYCKEKNGSHFYNVQALKAEIEFIEALNCKYACLSHDAKFIQERQILLKMHRSIYSKRIKNEPFIKVDDFFR